MENSRYERYLSDAKEKLGLQRLPTPALLLLIVVVIAVAGFAIRSFAFGSGLSSLFPSTTSTTQIDQGSSTEETEEDELSALTASVFVHVTGAVNRPGVYELPRNARGIDAIEAAGGLRDDAAQEALNLAALLEDGAQMHVLTKQEVLEQGGIAGNGSTGGTTGTSTGSQTGGKVNLNTADSAQLQTLSGIGPATADKIIADREKNGPYKSLEDLMRVSGIGEKRIEALREVATIK